MSSLTTAIQDAQAPSRSAGSDVVTTEDDAAASLRAVALSTLKSRRKVHSAGVELPASLPPRPVPVTSQVELDYGIEDSAASRSFKSPSASATASTTRPPLPSEPMDVDNGPAREEGEISDTESTPPKSPLVKAPQTTLRDRPTHAGKRSPKDRPVESPTMPPPSSQNAVPIKTDPTPPPVPEVRLGSKAPTQGQITPTSHDESMLVDEEYVRPGLARMLNLVYGND